MSKPERKDLAYNVLLLEQQLDAYQKLHEEEWIAIRKALGELKARILAMSPAEQPAPAGEGPAGLPG